MHIYEVHWWYTCPEVQCVVFLLEKYWSCLARMLHDICRKVMAWWLLGNLVHQKRKEVSCQELLDLTLLGCPWM